MTDASLSINNSSVFLGRIEMPLFCEQSTVITWMLKARTFVLPELRLGEVGRQSPRHKCLSLEALVAEQTLLKSPSELSLPPQRVGSQVGG